MNMSVSSLEASLVSDNLEEKLQSWKVFQRVMIKRFSSLE